MTMPEGFERTVSTWLRDEAQPSFPDRLDELLARTTMTRQRRWWSDPERWLPMAILEGRQAYVPPLPWRGIVLAVILVALIATALVVAGSQHRIPPPFGPAKNGLLTFATGGDIYGLDSVDGTPRALIAGETVDGIPSFSRDGRRLWFIRDLKGSGGGFSLMVANADGSNPRQLIALGDLPEWADQSPDGSVLAFAGRYQGAHGIYLMKTDGSEAPRRLDLGSDGAGWPMWRPPDGQELLYLDPGVSNLRLYGVKPDGTGRHLVDDLGPMSDISMGQFEPSLSSNGRFMVYAVVDPQGFRNHLVDLDTGVDRTLFLGPGGGHELHGVFSPDGSKLLFHYNDGSIAEIQEMLAPLDGSSPATRIGPPYPIVNGSADLNQAFSPDGKSIVIIQGRDRLVRIVDAQTGSLGRDVTWRADDLPAWQRVAP